MSRQKHRRDHEIAVDEHDHIAQRMVDTTVTPLGRTTMDLLNQPHMGEAIGVLAKPIRGSIG